MPKIEKGSNAPEDNYRIMLLLDKPEQLEEVAKVANELGHEVVSVSTVRKGMEFLDTKDHVDVVVAEAFLENESVFDFLTQLRSKPDHQNVPIMLLAAKPGRIGEQMLPTIEYTAKLFGAYKFIYMPNFDSKQLLREIDATVPKDTRPKKEEHPEGAY